VLNYSLALRTDRSPQDVDTLLQDLLAAARRDAGGGGLALAGLAQTVADASLQATLDEALEEHTDVEVRLELDPKADGYARARQDLAVVSAVVAARTAQAACLVLQYERVLMRLSGGRLTLHDWYPEWQDPEVVAALPVPFDRTPDPGLL
jgi:hypothetical protein